MVSQPTYRLSSPPERSQAQGRSQPQFPRSAWGSVACFIRLLVDLADFLSSRSTLRGYPTMLTWPLTWSAVSTIRAGPSRPAHGRTPFRPIQAQYDTARTHAHTQMRAHARARTHAEYIYAQTLQIQHSWARLLCQTGMSGPSSWTTMHDKCTAGGSSACLLARLMSP